MSKEISHLTPVRADLILIVVEHLRDWSRIDGEIRWDNLFANTQHQLEDVAIRAKKEIAEGYAKPMDFDQL